MAAIKDLDQQIRFQVVCGYSVIAGAATDGTVAARCRDAGFAQLKLLIKSWQARGQLELDPDLDELRKDPRFKMILG